MLRRVLSLERPSDLLVAFPFVPAGFAELAPELSHFAKLVNNTVCRGRNFPCVHTRQSVENA
jgi:hypothetical protein